MKNSLRKKHIQFKIKNRKFYLKITVTKDENLLDKIASYLYGEIDIIELNKSTDISDKYFLDFATKIKLLTAQFDKTLIISDRVDIAYLVEADGVCLSEYSVSIENARKILPPNTIIGAFNIEYSDIDYLISDKSLGAAQFIAKTPNDNTNEIIFKNVLID